MRDKKRLAAHEVPGLKEDVTIRVDRWGVAHIQANNFHDLSSRKAGMPHVIASGRSISRASAVSACWHVISAPAISNRTGRRGCFSIAAIWHPNGKPTGLTRKKSAPHSPMGSIPISMPAMQVRYHFRRNLRCLAIAPTDGRRKMWCACAPTR